MEEIKSNGKRKDGVRGGKKEETDGFSHNIKYRKRTAPKMKAGIKKEIRMKAEVMEKYYDE